MSVLSPIYKPEPFAAVTLREHPGHSLRESPLTSKGRRKPLAGVDTGSDLVSV